MKTIALIVLSSLITLQLSGQLYLSEESFKLNFNDEQGLKYFEEGSKLLTIGDYAGADSLLSLAMCTFVNENVYFNRAFSRLMQKDTLAFCEDMDIAANMYIDKEAASFFNLYCCTKVDTIYYDKKFNPATFKNYRYLEEIRYPKFLEDTIGIFHDPKASEIKLAVDAGCDENLFGVSFRKSDRIAVYQIFGSEKYYYSCPKPVSFFNVTKYRDLKQRAETLFQIKYGELKRENDLEKLTLYYRIIFSKNGVVTKVELTGVQPEIDLYAYEADMEIDIIKIVNNYPKLRPASFRGADVNYITLDKIEF
jgi:hypothetical protein